MLFVTQLSSLMLAPELISQNIVESCWIVQLITYNVCVCELSLLDRWTNRLCTLCRVETVTELVLCCVVVRCH